MKTESNTKKWLSISGPPDPPRNCTITNQTYDSLQVDCQEGFSSGLNQEFHMEVWTEMQLLVNITARSPRLLARGLPPGQVLFLRVYSSNSKGRSRSVRVEGYTLRKADHHIPGEERSMQNIKSWPIFWDCHHNEWYFWFVVGTSNLLCHLFFLAGDLTCQSKRFASRQQAWKESKNKSLKGILQGRKKYSILKGFLMAKFWAASKGQNF